MQIFQRFFGFVLVLVLLMASQGGINFYLGNTDEADGLSAIMPEPLGHNWRIEDITYLAEVDCGRELKPGEVSTYWTGRALKWIQAHPGRFHLLHLKDMDKKGGFTEVGRGTIDFPAVLEAAKGSGVKHAYIEQDETPGDPFESVKVSLEHLRSIS